MTSEKLREQVSAFLDGELSAEETDLLLKRLATNPELLQTANRFQLIKDTLNKHAPEHIDINFGRRLHERLRYEPCYSGGKAGGAGQDMPAPRTPARPSAAHRTKLLAGVAIAASVALAVILGGRLLLSPEPGLNNGVVAENTYQRSEGTRWSVRHKEVGSRLNSLLVNHSEYTSGTGLKGLFNFVQVAGYDAE